MVPAMLFFDILENNKLKALTIKGKPTENQLNKAWANIFDEFFKLKNDAKMRLVLKTKKEIIKLYRKIAIIEATVLSLVKFEFPKEKTIILIDLLAKGQIHIDKTKDLDAELLKVLQNDLAGYQTALKLEEHNLEQLTKGVKSTFEDSLVMLEGSAGYAIADNVTLKKYLSYERSAIKRSKNN